MKNFFKKHQSRIIVAVVIVFAVGFSFWYGGNSPGLQGQKPFVEADEPKPTLNVDALDATDVTDASDAGTQGEKLDSESAQNPVPVEPEDAVLGENPMTCTLSVRCDTVIDNVSWLNAEKLELIPNDGIVFPKTTVTFYEGESVFNVLLREMKNARVHMEFANVPMYNSAYIEGINNLYEFDCGEISGWMYKVNDWFPNYGCSRYPLQDGDVVEWAYTCNRGEDIGGYNELGGLQ